MRLALLIFAIALLSCGKRGDIYPPPPEGASSLPKTQKSSIAVGRLSYTLGDDGIAVLYWDFPFKYDYAEVYLNGRRIATVKGFSYIYPKPIERGKKYQFKVVVYKNGKPKGVANLEITP